MPRTPHSTDFHVDVDKIGRFCFARRQIADIYKIRGRYNVMTEGFFDDQGRMSDLEALAFVSIQTLIVESPPDFDVDKIDPLLDDDFSEKIMAIWGALRTKELSFRQDSTPDSKAAGS
jgi:hypothetical protein